MRSLFHRFAFLISCSLLFLTTAAKAQSFVWAQAISAVNSIRGAGVGSGATDLAGNFYTIGGFGGTVNFGGVSLTAARSDDMFVMKKDPAGNLIWVKQLRNLSGTFSGGGTGALSVDSAGNIFFSFTIVDSFDFDPGPAVYKLNSFGMPHAIVLKLDSAGNFI